MTKIKKFSIVPDMIKKAGIKFYDEKDLPIQLCEPLEGNPDIPQFQPPFLRIDTFAKRTAKPINIVLVQTTQELRQLGFIICVLKTPGQFRAGQKVTYRLRYKDDPVPPNVKDYRVLGYIPTDHTIQRDTNNARIRMCGRNAGRFGFSEWKDIR